MSIERESVHQILQNTGHTLSVQFYSGSDAVDPGAVTVTITNTDGTAIVTDGATSGSGTGPRTYVLTPAQTASLTTLTAVWTTDDSGSLADNTQPTTYAEVVGDLLFTIDDARKFAAADDQSGPLSSASKYGDDDIIRVRSELTDEIEQWCGVPFGRRYQRVVMDGSGTQELLLWKDNGDAAIHVSNIRSIEYRTSGQSSWTAYTSTELADVFVRGGGIIYRESLGTFARGIQNIRVGYEYGHQRVPRDIRRAALILARDKLVASNVGDRAISFTNEFGVVERRSIPGAKRTVYTGIPEVDGILMYHDERIPGVG